MVFSIPYFLYNHLKCHSVSFPFSISNCFLSCYNFCFFIRPNGDHSAPVSRFPSPSVGMGRGYFGNLLANVSDMRSCPLLAF